MVQRIVIVNDIWKLQMVKIYYVENVMQFKSFSSCQISELIKSICYNLKNAIIKLL